MYITLPGFDYSHNQWWVWNARYEHLHHEAKAPEDYTIKTQWKMIKFLVFWDSFGSAVNRNPNLSDVDIQLPDCLTQRDCSLQYSRLVAIWKWVSCHNGDRTFQQETVVCPHGRFIANTSVQRRPSHTFALFMTRFIANVRGLEALGVWIGQYGSSSFHNYDKTSHRGTFYRLLELLTRRYGKWMNSFKL